MRQQQSKQSKRIQACLREECVNIARRFTAARLISGESQKKQPDEKAASCAEDGKLTGRKGEQVRAETDSNEQRQENKRGCGFGSASNRDGPVSQPGIFLYVVPVSGQVLSTDLPKEEPQKQKEKKERR